MRVPGCTLVSPCGELVELPGPLLGCSVALELLELELRVPGRSLRRVRSLLRSGELMLDELWDVESAFPMPLADVVPRLVVEGCVREPDCPISLLLRSEVERRSLSKRSVSRRR